MKKIIYIVIFLISLWLVTKGRTINNYKGLILMLLGLGSILSQLYIYNKKYQ